MHSLQGYALQLEPAHPECKERLCHIVAQQPLPKQQRPSYALHCYAKNQKLLLTKMHTACTENDNWKNDNRQVQPCHLANDKLYCEQQCKYLPKNGW